MRTRVRLDLNASLWSGKPSTLRASVQDSAEDVDGVLFTEVAGVARSVMLHALMIRLGWDLAHHGAGPLGECAIAMDDTWLINRWKAYEIGPDLGPGDIVVAVVASVTNRSTFQTGVVSFAHLPASVEGTWRGRPRRVVEYLAAVRRWRRIVRRWRRRYKPTFVIVAADWNLNARKAWVRAWIRGMWPSLRLPAELPADGDHAGGRLIVWPITRGLVDTAVRVLPADGSSDHRRVRMSGTIRKARR